MTKRTPRQQRQSAAKMIASKQPASPGVKAGDVVLSAAEARRIERVLRK